MRRDWVAFLVLAVCGSGCGSSDGVADPSEPPGKSTGERRIEIARAGGILGETVEWRLHPDGRITSPDNVSLGEVAPARIEELFSLCAQTRQPGPSATTCADCYQYTIRCLSAEPRTLELVEGLPGSPPLLAAVLDLLDEIRTGTSIPPTPSN